jgi:hypothetical protein
MLVNKKYSLSSLIVLEFCFVQNCYFTTMIEVELKNFLAKIPGVTIYQNTLIYFMEYN